FPMGPFFWLSDLADLPDWVTQRLWWSLLLVVAFLGFVKLCGVLNLGSPLARIIGGVAFALSPRIITLIGTSSIEAWPSVVAPWVIVPLAIGLRRGNPRYFAALSGIAVACVGGVNATATFAVIPLGAILLLMAAPGPRRRSLIIWWPTFVLLGTLWWLIPLVLLGAYSPPFLDYIESAANSTFAANLFDGLRGTSYWVPYFDIDLGAGQSMITNPAIIANGTVVLALGLWGIARRDNPHARYLVVCVMTGLALVTLGHVGPVDGLGAGGVQDALDGVLAPLRNTHKFDPVVRIPLLLGFVHLISVVGTIRQRSEARPKSVAPTVGALVLAAAAVFGSTVPAWSANLPRSGTYVSVPDYWTDAADWLDTNAQHENSLLLPGSSFGDYLWGSPRDEVMQAYARSPWAVRNAVPLTPPGFIRTLDAVETGFAQGVGTEGLLRTLQRSGIKYLVMRNDLATTDRTDAETIYSALSDMPDIKRVAAFGPMFGNPGTRTNEDGESVFINSGRQTTHRVIEVFEVPGADASRARAQELSTTPVVVGTPAALLLQDGLVPATTNFMLGQDVPRGLAPERVVLTDTDRRREAAFSKVVNNRSASLTKNDPYSLKRRVHDYDTPSSGAWKSVRELIGARSIRASSSRSEASAYSVDSAQQPWSAFDSDRSTKWAASEFGAAWIEITFDRPTSVRGTTIELARGQPTRKVTIENDSGKVTAKLSARKAAVIDTPTGLTSRLRISVPNENSAPLSIADVRIPGVSLSRPLRLPVLPAGWSVPTDILLTAEDGQPICRVIAGVRRCEAGRDGLGEDGRSLDRIVTLDEDRSFILGLMVLAQSTPEATDALSGGVRLRSTSSDTLSPSTGLLAAIDGDPLTGWIAKLGETRPELTIGLKGTHELSSLQISTNQSLAASVPKRAVLQFSNGDTRSVTFSSSGLTTFDPVSTTSVKITVTSSRTRFSAPFYGDETGLPVGIGEVSFPNSDVNLSDDATKTIELPCGSGPDVTVGDRTFQTAVSGSRVSVVSGEKLPARLCTDDLVELNAGDNRIRVAPSTAFRPSLARLSTGELGLTTSRALATSRADDDHVEIADVPDGSTQLVSVAQNVNRGWLAAGANPVTVNGWMQGWSVEGGATIKASFSANQWYRAGLGAGAVAALLLLTSAWLLRRRSANVGPNRNPRQGLRSGAVLVFGTGAVLTLAGLTGLLVALLAGAVVLRVRRVPGEWVIAAAVTFAGGAYVVGHWTSSYAWAGSEPWAQWCVLAAIAGTFALAFEAPIQRFFNFMVGRSTNR
ncbi:MAG: alpha-(1-_3)-arabinofuranosyltransferase family protein, partial [Aeromicrobium sp.]